MSERKVLNKYYPPDYDPRRLPRGKGGGNIEDKIMIIRTMAPFHMRCTTCGNYIYRGTKFNSRVETIKGERYLGTIPIRRFYIRCTKCVATITFKTDPENQDYAMETGATRNFEAKRMWDLLEKKEEDAKKEEERLNPMVALENRTAKSNQTMVMQENLEELFELAELAGDGQSTRLTALKKITDAKELEQKLKQLLLEKEITLVTQEQSLYRDDKARMDEFDEQEEDEDQKEVRQIFRNLKSSELLTLNMDQDESPIFNAANDKRQRKIMEATDKAGSKKKFSNLIKIGKGNVPTGKVGMSYKEVKQRIKKKEEEKKREEEKKMESQQRLTTMLSGYGSSSSSDEGNADCKKEQQEEKENGKTENENQDEGEEIVQAADDAEPVKTESPDEPTDLPEGFFDQIPKLEKVEEAPKKRKASASFGTDDFWSSVTKKKA